MLSGLIKRPDKDSKFLSKGSGFKGFDRKERERERKDGEMVFNPKTSGALEGDNRKSIRPIKSVRKPVVERTGTSCIINLFLSLSLFLDNIYRPRSEQTPRFEILIDDTDRIHATDETPPRVVTTYENFVLNLERKSHVDVNLL